MGAVPARLEAPLPVELASPALAFALAGGLAALGAALLLLWCRFARGGFVRALVLPFRAHLAGVLALGLVPLALAPVPGTGAAALGLALALGLVAAPGRGANGGLRAGTAPPPAAAPAFRAVAYNVLFRQHRTCRAEAWLAAQAPDLLFLVEASPAWRGVEARLARHLPWRAEVAYDPRRGEDVRMVLLSRHPITAAGPMGVPGTRRRVLRAEVALPAGRLTFIGLHAPSPKSPAFWRWRDAFLAGLAGRIALLPGPVLVMGDCNAPLADPAFRHFVAAGGLVAAAPARTWPAWAGPLAIGIDHALARGGLLLDPARAGPRLGSDHRPISIAFRLADTGRDAPP